MHIALIRANSRNFEIEKQQSGFWTHYRLSRNCGSISGLWGLKSMKLTDTQPYRQFDVPTNQTRFISIVRMFKSKPLVLSPGGQIRLNAGARVVTKTDYCRPDLSYHPYTGLNICIVQIYWLKYSSRRIYQYNDDDILKY